MGARERRLLKDFEEVKKLVQESNGLLVVRHYGNPPEVYYIEIRGIYGIERINEEKRPILRDYHEFTIDLRTGYPYNPPRIYFNTPIFHPNIWPSRLVCIEDVWNPSHTLRDIIIDIVNRIQYYSPEKVNLESVANKEAAEWVRNNKEWLFSKNRNDFPRVPFPPTPVVGKDEEEQIEW